MIQLQGYSSSEVLGELYRSDLNVWKYSSSIHQIRAVEWVQFLKERMRGEEAEGGTLKRPPLRRLRGSS